MLWSKWVQGETLFIQQHIQEDLETLIKGHGESLATGLWFISERENSRKALVEEAGRWDKGQG